MIVLILSQNPRPDLVFNPTPLSHGPPPPLIPAPEPPPPSIPSPWTPSLLHKLLNDDMKNFGIKDLD